MHIISIVKKIDSLILENVFNKVLRMTLGSIPLWICLVIWIHPSRPGISQVRNPALVGLFSGVFATGIFLFARTLARNSNERAAVDATQSSEVVFALKGGILVPPFSEADTLIQASSEKRCMDLFCCLKPAKFLHH